MDTLDEKVKEAFVDASPSHALSYNSVTKQARSEHPACCQHSTARLNRARHVKCCFSGQGGNRMRDSGTSPLA